MIPCCFAIIPDQEHQPIAVFADLQDALDWGMWRLGGSTFRVKHISIARIESDSAGSKSLERAGEGLRS